MAKGYGTKPIPSGGGKSGGGQCPPTPANPTRQRYQMALPRKGK